MMIRLAGFVLLVLAGVAQADDLSVRWDLPTMMVDNQPIPATGPSALRQTRVDYHTCVGGTLGARVGQAWAPHPDTSLVLKDVAPGTYCIRAFAQNNAGEWSGPSNQIVRVVEAPPVKPMPPVLVSVVNVAVLIDSSYRIRIVGTVPIGTACDGSQQRTAGGTRFSRVDASSVTLFEGQRSGDYWTVCG